MSTTIGIKVDDLLRERIRNAAQNLNRTPHWLIKQAVVQYVDALERGATTIRVLGADEATPEDGREEAQPAAPQEAQPFLAFAQSILPQTPLRAAITAAWHRPETECLPALLPLARTQDEAQAAKVRELATRLVQGLRDAPVTSGVAALVQEFSLSSQEGVALMCLAEALLRIPDKATRDALIRDKISRGDWKSHVGRSPSLFVNAAAWGLVLTGKLTSTNSEKSLSSALTRVIGKGGEPLIRQAERAPRHEAHGRTIRHRPERLRRKGAPGQGTAMAVRSLSCRGPIQQGPKPVEKCGQSPRLVVTVRVKGCDGDGSCGPVRQHFHQFAAGEQVTSVDARRLDQPDAGLGAGQIAVHVVDRDTVSHRDGLCRARCAGEMPDRPACLGGQQIADGPMLDQLGRVLQGRMGRQIAGAGAVDSIQLAQGFVHQRVIAHIAHPDHAIDVLAERIRVAVGTAETEFELGMLLQKRRQRGRNQAPDDAVGHTNVKLAGDHLLVVGEQMANLVQVADDHARHGQKSLAVVCQANLPGGAVQQAHAQLAFQHPNGHRNRGRWNFQGARRADEAARIEDLHENAKLMDPVGHRGRLVCRHLS